MGTITSKISDKYVFKVYDPIFPELYIKEKKRIEEGIGVNFRIEHVGSTAVTGLGGKGVIDIYIEVPSGEMLKVSQRIQGLGYLLKSNAGSKTRLFHEMDLPDPIDGIRRYHVHVVDLGNNDLMSAILLRNYLRTHIQAVEEYKKAKQIASHVAGPNGENYVSSKAGVIKKIIKKAFYDIVRSIPRGKVTTYGQLAKACGFKTPRYVGYLLGQNTTPETVPCHRVIHSSGILAGNYAFGGLEAKKKKLEAEGIEIKNGRVDLRKYGWNPELKFDD